MEPTLKHALSAWFEAEARTRGIERDLTRAIIQLNLQGAEAQSRRLTEARSFAAEMLSTTLQLMAQR
jgi:hypothetical protein